VKVPRRFLIDTFIIVTYIALFSLPLNVFWGLSGLYSDFPKGDDAHTHAALTLFVSENWPHINWYPDWYSGLPIFLSYHPLAYFFWGLFVRLTDISATSTLFLFTAVSITLTAIALYALIFKITSSRYAALASPILLTTSGGFISPLLAGGIYTRLFATMFWMLSLVFLFDHIRDPHDKKPYVITVMLLAATITSNMLIGLFSIVTAALTMVFCSESVKKGTYSSLRVFVPTIMLSAFFYLPFLVLTFGRFFSFTIGGGHYPIPQPLIYLVAGSTVPLFLLLVVALIRRYWKIELELKTRRFSKVLIALIVFFFFYGFTDLPSIFRIMATYDSTYFLAIYISIYCGIVLGAIFNRMSKQPVAVGAFGKETRSKFLEIMTRGRRRFPIVVLLLVLILPLSYYPLLMQYVVDPGAPSWAYPAYIADQIVNLNPSEKNFRFSSDWVHVVRWFNYRYDLPQTEGVQLMAVLHPQWTRWFQDAVFMTAGNWMETNFLLDWYGVKWLLVSKVIHSSGGGEFFKRYDPIEKFIDKPEYYKVESSVEVPSESYWSGPVYFLRYEDATPILSSSNAVTVLVVGEDSLYDQVFRSLAPSGYDSRYLIPIRGSAYIDDYSFEELRKFNVVILDTWQYHEADRTRSLLENYVINGGGLVIETGDIDASVLANINPANQTRRIVTQDWNLTYVSNELAQWIDFKYFSTPSEYWVSSGKIQPKVSILLMNNGSSSVVMGTYGKGRVIYDGLRISSRTSTSSNQMESFFFSKLIELAAGSEGSASSMRVIESESTEGWTTYIGGRETAGSLYISSNFTRNGHNTIALGYKFNASVLEGEYVEYKYAPRASLDCRKGKLLSFWANGDNSTNQLKIAILSPDWSNSFQTSIRLDWLGWRKVIIPLSIFGPTGSPKLTGVSGISFVIEEKETAQEREKWQQVYLDEVDVIQLKESSNDDGYFISSDPEHFELTLNHASGVLFKESFFSNWFAYLVDDRGVPQDLSIYRAGPDFMYVSIPSDTRFPAELTFEYRISFIEKVGYASSFLTLVTLVAYGLWQHLCRLLRLFWKTPKKIMSSTKGDNN